MAKRKHDGANDEWSSPAAEKKQRVETITDKLEGRCSHRKDDDPVMKPLMHIFWFCIPVANQPGPVSPMTYKSAIGSPHMSPTGSWGYGRYKGHLQFSPTGAEHANGMDLGRLSCYAFEAVFYHRRRLDDIQYRLLHRCLQPSEIRDLVFDKDALGSIFDGIQGVPGIIWDYFNPAKLHFAGAVVVDGDHLADNPSKWKQYDLSLFDTASWQSQYHPPPEKTEVVIVASHVFDLTEWGPIVFESVYKEKQPMEIV